MQTGEMFMKSRGKVFWPVIIFLVYLILDYINLPYVFNIKIANINIDLFGALLDAVIVVVLYLFSYFYIENRQKLKDENAKNVVKILFNKTYDECLKNLIFLDSKEIIKEYIIPKIDGNKTSLDNRIITNFQKLPFSSFDTIMNLATNGYISDDDFATYVEVQREYQYLINMKITFYDLDTAHTPEQIAMANDIITRNTALKNRLNALIDVNSNQGGIKQ